MPTLSIITASHKNVTGLMSLYNSIKLISSNDFEWIIKDSGHCIATSQWLGTLIDARIIYNTEHDTGIYSALNTAIKSSNSDYYITIGSDDSIDPIAFSLLLKLLSKEKYWGADVISFPVFINEIKKNRSKITPTFVSASGIISSHSVGTIIRKKLHHEIGYYDESYKILADSFFILTAYKKNKKFIYPKISPIGSFSLTGISSNMHALKIIEAYNYNVQLNSSIIIQSILLAFRLIRYQLNAIDFNNG